MLNFERFEAMRVGGRLLRGDWVGTDAEGRGMACWLAAMSAPVAAAESADACPAEDLPQWLAHLIPILDDEVSIVGWADRARRLGAALYLTIGWPAQHWRHAEARVILAILGEARSHAQDCGEVQSAIDAVAALWQRVADGDEPAADEWSAAELAAELAADAAEWAAEWAAERASKAAIAAIAASRAADAAIEAAAAAREAALSADVVALSEAWDRICDGVIAALGAGGHNFEATP